MPSASPTSRAVGRAIAGEQDQPIDPERPHGGERLARFAARLIAQHEAAEAPAAVRDPHLRDVLVVLRDADGDAELVEQRPPPEHRALAVDHGDHAEARPLLQIASAAWLTMPRASASATTARETGCSEPKPHEAATTAGACPRTSPAAGRISVTVGAPTVTVPVLSRISVSTSEARSRKSTLLIRMRRRVATVIAATTAAGPGDDQRRRRRHDEHGDRARQILGEEQRGPGDGEHERQPHAGAPLEEPQHGNRGALDVGQQLHDAAEHGVGAGAAHLNLEQAVERDGAGEDRAARADVVVERFAGDRGLIDGGASLEHGAVDGDPLAGPDEDLVARHAGCSGSTRSSTPLRHCTACRAPSARIPSMAARAPSELRSSNRRPTSRNSGISVAVTKSPVAAAASTAIATS